MICTICGREISLFVFIPFPVNSFANHYGTKGLLDYKEGIWCSSCTVEFIKKAHIEDF